jgi:hypothetical protein
MTDDKPMTATDYALIGIPMSEPSEPPWSADLTSATTADLARPPMKDRSPWTT